MSDNNNPDTDQSGRERTASPKTQPFKVCSVLGLPGAGKGTLCAMIKDRINFAHLSVGDHVRALCMPDADTKVLDDVGLTQDELKELLAKRQSVPTHQIGPIVRAALTEICDAGKHRGVLVDGYPREMHPKAEKKFDEDFPLVCLIKLKCKEQTAKSRFLARRRAADDTGEVWDHRAEKFRKNQPAIDKLYCHVLFEVYTEEDGGQEEAAKAMLEELKWAGVFSVCS